MVKHSKDYLYAYKVENASYYAEGNAGGAVHACTPFGAGDVASLTATNLPKDGAMVPVKIYKRELIEAASFGADRRLAWIKGQEYKDFVLPQYLQSEVWMDDAFGSKTGGSIPTSYVFHEELPHDQFDVCGAVIKEYNINIPESDDFPTEKVTFTYWDVVDSVAVTNFATSKPFITTQPKIKKDFVLYLDSDEITDLITMDLTVTLEPMEDPIAGKIQKIDPYLNKRRFKLTADFYTDSAAQLHIPSTETPSLITIKLNIGDHYVQVTNTLCTLTNEGELPSFGLKKYHVEIEGAGDCAYSTGSV
ncbi:MAG: hypothetical protein ACTSYF_07050 [Promethearchaeota archaeon]